MTIEMFAYLGLRPKERVRTKSIY